jgi:hypothetical protein
VYHVAETYPWNPYVQVEVLPYTRYRGGGTGAVTNYVLLMQTLELAHQKRKQKRKDTDLENQKRKDTDLEKEGWESWDKLTATWTWRSSVAL